MKKFILDNKINISFFIIAFLCLTLFVGAENISFEKTLWLHDDGGDSGGESSEACMFVLCILVCCFLIACTIYVIYRVQYFS